MDGRLGYSALVPRNREEPCSDLMGSGELKIVFMLSLTSKHVVFYLSLWRCLYTTEDKCNVQYEKEQLLDKIDVKDSILWFYSP